VNPERLLSAQDHTKPDGYRLTRWRTQTIRCGKLMYFDGEVLGA
jgi:hypothetical protein